MEEPIDKIIKVTLPTRERLKKEGNKGETYENIINHMFAELEGYRRART